jgi:hypothetical protein
MFGKEERMDQSSTDQGKLAKAEEPESKNSGNPRSDPPPPPAVDNVQIVKDPDGDS